MSETIIIRTTNGGGTLCMPVKIADNSIVQSIQEMDVIDGERGLISI